MAPEEEEAFLVNMQRLRDDIGYCLQEGVYPYCGNNETFSKQFSEMERQKQYYCPKCGFGVDVQSIIDW